MFAYPRRKREEVMAEIPQYRSHKLVRAFKVTELAPAPINFDAMRMKDINEMLVYGCENGRRVYVARVNKIEWLNRIPEGSYPTDGYFVQYEDNFQSWSPSKAFEEGYTLVKDENAEFLSDLMSSGVRRGGSYE